MNNPTSEWLELVVAALYLDKSDFAWAQCRILEWIGHFFSRTMWSDVLPFRKYLVAKPIARTHVGALQTLRRFRVNITELQTWRIIDVYILKVRNDNRLPRHGWFIFKSARKSRKSNSCECTVGDSGSAAQAESVAVPTELNDVRDSVCAPHFVQLSQSSPSPRYSNSIVKESVSLACSKSRAPKTCIRQKRIAPLSRNKILKCC